MNRDTTVTLDQVHDGILEKIAAQFPAFETVTDYDAPRKGLPVPAFLLELDDMEGAPDEDPGTEQLAVMATFAARIVLPFRAEPGKKSKREIRKLAGAVAAFARLQRWGCPIGPAEVLGAYPDDFSPELDQYEVWRVEWRQLIHLGETVWTDDGDVPTTPLGSYVPLVGPDYRDSYVPLADLGEGAP